MKFRKQISKNKKIATKKQSMMLIYKTNKIKKQV